METKELVGRVRSMPLGVSVQRFIGDGAGGSTETGGDIGATFGQDIKSGPDARQIPVDARTIIERVADQSCVASRGSLFL